MRKLLVQDAPIISELENLVFDNALNERTLGIQISHGFGWVLGEPITGFILCGEDGDLVDVLRLAVHPDHQGKGFGRRLLQKVLGLRRPMMLTVKRDNQKALNLYHALGFEISGTLLGSWVMYRVPS